jgi:osmoprotectant transport system ATP-binding protein
MDGVEFREVSFGHTRKTPILDRFTLTVDAGACVALVGASGAGKTTALKLVNRLLVPDAGHVRVEGRDTREWDPIRLRRSVGYVIQDVGLFPHFTVAANVGLVPRLEGWKPADIGRRVDQLLDTVGMPGGEFRARYPRELSGGQRQRVGVARALAADPPLLLFDEPFGALDPVTRFELQQQFLELQRTFHKTSIFVTHDVREALRLGSRIALLAGGRLEVNASPAEFQGAQTSEARALARAPAAISSFREVPPMTGAPSPIPGRQPQHRRRRSKARRATAAPWPRWGGSSTARLKVPPHP